MRKEVREEVREEVWEEVCEEVKVENRRETILEFLSELGKIPDDIQKAVMSESRNDVLKAMVKVAAKATSFSDFQEKVGKMWRLQKE